jgi:hypothetical protein
MVGRGELRCLDWDGGFQAAVQIQMASHRDALQVIE